MSSSPAPLRATVDSSTQRENSTGNQPTAHGFGRIPLADTRTVTHATTDTSTVTATNTTPLIFPYPVAFTQPDMQPPRRPGLREERLMRRLTRREWCPCVMPVAVPTTCQGDPSE